MMACAGNEMNSRLRSKFQLTISFILFIKQTVQFWFLVFALFILLLKIPFLQISYLLDLFYHSGLRSNVISSERTFLIAITIVSSNLSWYHCLLSYSLSESILSTCLVFVSKTTTFYDFWKKVPWSFKALVIWPLRLLVALSEALLLSFFLFSSHTDLVLLLHQNMQSTSLWTIFSLPKTLSSQILAIWCSDKKWQINRRAKQCGMPI